MILSTAIFLTTLGFGAFILGHLQGYQGIAAIGAVLIVGIGAAAMVNGLETRSGEVQTQIDANTTEVQTQYSPIGTTQSFPTGLLVTLLGGAMTARVLDDGGG